MFSCDHEHDGTTAGRNRPKGVEIAAAVRRIERPEVWGNVAFTQAAFSISISQDLPAHALERRPSTVMRRILSLQSWRWRSRWRPVRHVGNRFCPEQPHHNGAYTTQTLAFLDVAGRELDNRRNNVRFRVRVRNLTTRLMPRFRPAAIRPVYLGAPRTTSPASLKW